jgi:hypothetical protein
MTASRVIGLGLSLVNIVGINAQERGGSKYGWSLSLLARDLTEYDTDIKIFSIVCR